MDDEENLKLQLKKKKLKFEAYSICIFCKTQWKPFSGM